MSFTYAAELSCAVGDMSLKADAVHFRRTNRGLARVSGIHDRAFGASSFQEQKLDRMVWNLAARARRCKIREIAQHVDGFGVIRSDASAAANRGYYVVG